jgi:hypothetical protein
LFLVSSSAFAGEGDRTKCGGGALKEDLSTSYAGPPPLEIERRISKEIQNG